MLRHLRRAGTCGAFILSLSVLPATALGQTRSLADSLVSRAIAVNPRLRAAEAQAGAARSRIAPAGAWLDPMLMGGIQNLPLSRAAASPQGTTSGGDPMTMKMVGVTQTIPYPGKTSLRTVAARAVADAAIARLEIAQRQVRREVLHAYHELVEARMLLRIVERKQQVASGILPAAEARYVSGGAAQADVLKARTEAAMLVRERNAVLEQERTALARLNALLDQPSGTAVATDSLSEHPDADTILPSLDSLQEIALQANPRIRELRAMIAGQTAQAQLARREYLPDFDVSLQYGQRDRLPDMITATVSIAVPVQRGRKQAAHARAAQFEVGAAEAELRAEENGVASEVAQAYAAVERDRANLSLLDRAILPQARATFASASVTYQAGRGELLNVLDAMRALFATETMYTRTLTELAKSLADLQVVVGAEVLP